MQANPSLQPAAPWYRHRWPWFLMIGPVLVLVGGVVMIWLATSRPDAMVVGDYYKQGKAINQELRRDRVAGRLGLVFEAGHDAAVGRVTGSLRSHGEPVRQPFRIRLAHPTQPERDRVLEALPDGQGRFAAEAPGLEPTHWQVVVEGASKEDGWRLAGSWSPAKESSLRIRADAE
ncbi:FixH family protein [Massilia sp. BSC265]|uniref:FixH family protein n=1 Tax=Massilia sp. BSC265 TaxID=1549812 RepID=UPI0004E927E7|nr:FixH family protein [Massilia sp. BSC265]KFI08361.1 cytochrome oxidase assembly protein [Massilia sp. BSC265]